MTCGRYSAVYGGLEKLLQPVVWTRSSLPLGQHGLRARLRTRGGWLQLGGGWGGHTHSLPAGWSHLPVPCGLAGLVTHSLLLNYGFLSLCPINMLVLVFIFVTHVVL